jgi:hypothetical protein
MATGNAVRMPEPAEPEMPNLVIPTDAGASPFKLVVDPALRSRLRKALLELVDNHDQELAKYAAEGFLELESSKEYVEILAGHLRETMSTKEGVAYLLHACGFEVPSEEINLQAEARWKVSR